MLRVCILLLATLMVSACGSPRTASAPPTLDAHTLLSPIPHTPEPLPVPTTFPGVSPTPSAPTAPVPRLVHQLPLDQPWILLDETLIAVSEDGVLLQLDVPVSEVLVAPDESPLIVAHPDTSHYTLRNTQTWTDRPLDLPDHLTVARGAVLAPNGAQFAFFAWSRADRPLVRTADPATGAVRTLITGSRADPIMPLAWNGPMLFTHTQISATSYFWRTDTTAQTPHPQELLLVGDTGPWAIAPNGTALVWSYMGHPLYLRDLQTNTDYVLTPTTNAYTIPLISPNSRTLALMHERSSGGCCELLFFDLDKRPPAPIGNALQREGLRTSVQGIDGWAWSQDSERLLVVTLSHIGLLKPDGTFLGRAPLPGATRFEALGLADDDHVLMITRNGANVSLQIIPVTSNEPGQRKAVRLPDITGSYAIVYLPRAT